MVVLVLQNRRTPGRPLRSRAAIEFRPRPPTNAHRALTNVVLATGVGRRHWRRRLTVREHNGIVTRSSPRDALVLSRSWNRIATSVDRFFFSFLSSFFFFFPALHKTRVFDRSKCVFIPSKTLNCYCSFSHLELAFHCEWCRRNTQYWTGTLHGSSN